MSFFNYFTDRERGAVARANRLKTAFASAFAPLLARLGMPPDAISYTGLAMLLGVVIWFVAHPYRATAMIALYLICDAIDGGYARYLDRPTQAGAFTDVVVDQLGMVVIALGFIYYDFVDGQVGAYYIMIYLVMITFSLVQNAHGIPMQYILRSKYVLYAIYAFWAFFKVNLAPFFMPLFCIAMTLSCVQSYLRLKQGFYERYDVSRLAEIDKRLASQGKQPPRFRRVWNFLLPGGVIVLLMASGAYTYLATLFARANLRPEWETLEPLPLAERHEQPQGITAFRGGFLVSTFNPQNNFSRIYYLQGPSLRFTKQFVVPWDTGREQGLCAVKDELYMVGRGSGRVLSIDPDLSLNSGYAVANGSFDTTLHAPASCAIVPFDGHPAMLIAEFMHTAKTILVDYKKALADGTAHGYILAWYRNAGFVHGLASKERVIYEANSSLGRDVIYQVDLEAALADKYIRTGIIKRLAAPRRHCTGVAVWGKTIIALDESRLYKAELP